MLNLVDRARSPVVVATVLGVAALALRLPHLMEIPRFTDEIDETAVALKIVQGRSWPLHNEEPYIGPLFNYLVAAALLLGGTPFEAPRYLVAAFGALTVAATFALGRSLGGPAVGTMAGLFMMLAPAPIAVNSHIGWSNCVTPVFTTTGLWLLHTAVRTGSGRWLIGSAVVLALALQTHPTVLFLFVGIAAFIAWRHPELLRRRALWIAAGIGAIMCLNFVIINLNPVAPSIKEAMRVQADYASGEQLTFWSYWRRLALMLMLISDSLGGVLLESGPLQGPFASPPSAFMIALLLVGVELSWRRGITLPVICIAAVALLMPLANARYASLVPKARYAGMIMPLAYVTIAVTLVSCYRFASALSGRPAILTMARGLVAVVGVAAVVVPFVGLLNYYRDARSTGATNAALLRVMAEIASSRRGEDPVYLDRALRTATTLGGGAVLEHLYFDSSVQRWPRRTFDVPKLGDPRASNASGLLVVDVSNAGHIAAMYAVEPVDVGSAGRVRAFWSTGLLQDPFADGSFPAELDPPSEAPVLEPMLTGLRLPAALAFGPDGRLFFAEVVEGLVRIATGSELQADPFVAVRVPKGREQGVLGIALDPSFAINRWVYVFYSEADERFRPTRNRVVRFTEKDGRATEPTPILDTLPVDASDFNNGSHNGGRIGFGRDGKLYVSVGESGRKVTARDPRTLNGKILRVNPDGSVPTDNPTPGSIVYASGMRNAWGMTFHPETGELWVTDNGPNGHDEVNRILPGNDYGYPTIDGGRGRVPGLVDPLWESGNERLGITGATFYTGDRLAEFRGDLFFCDFVTGTLRRARLSPTQDTIAAVQKMGQNCRLDVAQGPDGALYLADIGAIHRWAR